MYFQSKVMQVQSLNLGRLLAKKKQQTISVLPDFYLDIIIDPKISYKKLMTEIDHIYSRGGGNLLGTSIQLIPGGNGCNVARVLTSLGASTTFLTETSPFGKVLIEYYLHSFNINTVITTSGTISSSVILEIPTGDSNRSNVMMSDAGSLANFNSSKLNLQQWQILKTSNAIAITNAANLQMENLVEHILTNVPSSTVVSIDFSDLTPHIYRIDAFRNKILSHSTKAPTIIVGNENELPCLAGNSNLKPKKAAKNLSDEFPEIIFGLHESKQAQVWKNGEQLAEKACFNVKVIKKVTGAGDAWHAGFLFAVQQDLSLEDATIFANAVAGYYISSNDNPTVAKIIEFMNKTSLY